MDMQVDAQLIRDERLKRAWSQEHLAEVSGLSLRTVQRIEKGGNASLETVKALSAVLELPVRDLLATEPGDQLQISLSKPPAANPGFSPFKPWRTFAAGFLASITTMGGFLFMQGAIAQQIDMDFSLSLGDEEITRSRLVGDSGAEASIDVSEVVRISITPTIRDDGTILLDAQIFLFNDGEYRPLAFPKLLTTNGQKAVFAIGNKLVMAEDGSVQGEFPGVEFQITPVVK